MIRLPKNGEESLRLQLARLKIKREKILDAGLDTAIDTPIPTIEDIRSGISEFEDEDGNYFNTWGVTENYDIPISLYRGTDFVGYEEICQKFFKNTKGRKLNVKVIHTSQKL